MSRRLFCIWNRNYKRIYVIADDINEALTLAVAARHMRARNLFRKFEDVTESNEHVPGDRGMLERALDFGKSGIATFTENDGWKIDGQLAA